MFISSLGGGDVCIRYAVSYKPQGLELFEDDVKIKVELPFRKSNYGTRHSRISLIAARRDTEKGEPNQ